MGAGQERILRRRIKSVNSTRKITRAMELIAASRIAKAQLAITAARPYVDGMTALLAGLADNFEARKHPIFTTPEQVRGSCIIIVAADRGLCGPYNANVLRAGERLLKSHESEGRERRLIIVGKRAQSYFRYRGYEPVDSFLGFTDRPTHADAARVAARVVQVMGEEDVDLVQVVYTRFVSTGTQAVTTDQIYPVERLAPPEETAEDYARHEVAGEHHVGGTGKATFVDYEFEPDADVLLDTLVPRVVETRLYGALLDASASEHASRQRAMKAATDNADELAKNLTRLMNRARQESITTEIAEIVGGAEALSQAR